MKTNPRVNMADVREGLALVEMLREMGIEPCGYNLASPYAPRRRVG